MVLSETNQVAFNKESIKEYGDKVAISDPATTYLASIGLRTNEIFDFKSVAKIGMKLNIAEPKLRSIIMDLKDKLYVDTPFVIDPFFSYIKSKFIFKHYINLECRDRIWSTTTRSNFCLQFSYNINNNYKFCNSLSVI